VGNEGICITYRSGYRHLTSAISFGNKAAEGAISHIIIERLSRTAAEIVLSSVLIVHYQNSN
jgi:hypothetical protein